MRRKLTLNWPNMMLKTTKRKHKEAERWTDMCSFRKHPPHRGKLALNGLTKVAIETANKGSMGVSFLVDPSTFWLSFWFPFKCHNKRTGYQLQKQDAPHESQSKPGITVVDPEPCKDIRRRPQLFTAHM